MINTVIALIIFIGTFYLIFSEKMDRAIGASIGAVLMVVFGMYFKFYTQEEAFKAIDFNTLGLLIGMMIVISVLKGSGFFEYLAIRSAKLAKGDPWKLVVIMGTTTTLISMFLDNVTTVIIMAPITVLIANILGISPIPMLMAEALLSNIGGTGTLVGDPPNILIGSAAKFSFNDFLTHTLPPVILVWLVSLLILRVVFRKEFKKKSDRLSTVMEMDENKTLKDKKTLEKCLIVLGVILVLFLLHEIMHLKVSFVVLIGAILVFILVKLDINEVFKDIEWSVLIFFIGLFVVVGGLESVGIFFFIGEKIKSFAEYNMFYCLIAIFWCSAIISGIVGAVPFVLAMIPIIKHISLSGVSTSPLWWGLALGCGLGGNSTPIGTAANIIVIAISEKTSHPITFRMWIKSGLLVMIATCLATTGFLLLFYNLYTTP